MPTRSWRTSVRRTGSEMSRQRGRSIVEVVDINASRARVWEVLSDVESWPSWTPTMTSVAGRAGAGLFLGADFEIRQPGLRPSTMRVVELSDGESFTWMSSSPGLRATAGHAVTETGESRSQVELSFSLSGFMAPLVWVVYGRTIKEFVVTEAASLKTECEQ